MLAKEFRNLYRAPETGYGSMDFNGKGYITQDELLQSIVFKRMSANVPEDDLMGFITHFNLFPL